MIALPCYISGKKNCEPGNIEKHAEATVSKATLKFLGLKGGLLRANMISCSDALGEQINEDTLVVHIGFSRSAGAYAVINPA